MNIIISGAGYTNKGAEAMARTVQVELSKRLNNTAFFLWRLRESDLNVAYASGMTPIFLPTDLQSSPWRNFGGTAGLRMWSLYELCRNRQFYLAVVGCFRNNLFEKACTVFLKKQMKCIDAFIDISGFSYGDSWGTGGFRKIRPVIANCQLNKAPLVFLPQAWGSFEQLEVRNELTNLLSNKKTKFYSRDNSSSRYLEKALDNPKGSISTKPDIVFGFQEVPSDLGKYLLKGMGCKIERPIVGIAPNMRAFNQVGDKSSANIYLQALVKLILHCIGTYDIDIVLQANEIVAHSPAKDDRYLCSLISALVDRPDRCFMTKNYLTAEETKSIIGQFDFIVSSRFHSLVFALSQGVPGMAVSWSHKYKELMSLFSMEGYVQECHDLDVQAMIEIIERGLSEREQLHVEILQKAKQLRLEVEKLFDEVAELIKESTL